MSRPVSNPDNVAAWRIDQEREKVDKYLERCENVGWTFIPFVMDLWGGLAPAAAKFMAHYTSLLTNPVPADRHKDIEATVWQRLSVTVIR